jgi:hypothetical protein
MKLRKNMTKGKVKNDSKLKLLLLFTLSFSMTSMFAQETIPTAGGEAVGAGGTVSYSVGQIFYQSYSDNNASVTEGVQQAYEISIVTSLNEAEDINLEMTAYPNPTTDFLTLDIQNMQTTALSFQLIDIQGKQIESKEISTKQTQIQMKQLVSATYFVRVYRSGQVIKTFKIIKR